MKRTRIRYYLIIALCLISVITNAIGVFILPRNLPSQFHMARLFYPISRWLLFIFPIMMPIVFLFFEIVARKYKGNTLKSLIAKLASIIIPCIGYVTNILFIRRSLNAMHINLVNQTFSLHNTMTLTRSIILVIVIILSIYVIKKV